MTVRNATLAIRWICIAILAVALLIRSEALSLVLILVGILAALAILWRHLPALSGLEDGHPKVHTLRQVTIFNVVVLALVAGVAFAVEQGGFVPTLTQSKWFMSLLFALIILVFGNLAPKLPHTRHTGLRLPWTVRDEQTWLVAHRMLGWLSLPFGSLCLTAAAIPSPELSVRVLVALLLLWITIPSVLSLVFYYKKMYGKW